MNNPEISIIVPVYNVEKYIHPCLDSILAQTITDWECILVDDGSKDDSGKICDEYAAKDTRFVVVHKQNEGVAKARITAFEHSKGELITFIDSDDYVSPEYLEKLSKPILEDGADMVSSDYLSVKDSCIVEPTAMLTGIYEDSQIQNFIANHYFYDKHTGGYGMTIFLYTKMIVRHLVLEGLKLGEGMWYAEDQIAVFHILQRCHKLVLISDRLYYYVQRKGSAMTKYDMSLWENLIVLMKKYEELDVDNIAAEGRRIRTWKHIQFTIWGKMAKKNLNRADFVSHLSKVRDSEFMKNFFQPSKINQGIKDNVRYWLLKMNLYNLLYLDMKRSAFKYKLLSR